MDTATACRDFEEELRSFQRDAGNSKRDDVGFLRYAWSASLAQQDDREVSLEFNREAPPLFSAQRLQTIERRLSRVIEVLGAAEKDAPRHWEPEGNVRPKELFDLLLPLHRGIAWCRARRGQGPGNIPKARPVGSRRRMVFVCAMMPYMKHFGIWPGGTGDRSDSERGRWAWFRRWEDFLGRVRITDYQWLQEVLCRGGLHPSDWAITQKFKEEPKAPTRDVESWFRKAARKRERWQEMCRGAQAFIEWRRGLFRLRQEEQEQRWSRPLDGEEMRFANAAVTFLTRHDVAREFIADQRWSFLSRIERTTKKRTRETSAAKGKTT